MMDGRLVDTTLHPSTMSSSGLVLLQALLRGSRLTLLSSPEIMLQPSPWKVSSVQMTRK